MAMRVNPETGEVGLKQRYRVTNWSEYDRALVNRGNLTIWFDDESLRDKWTPPPPVGRGTPGRYSDVAIQTCLTIKGLFQLPYRATEGLVRSLMASLVYIAELLRSFSRRAITSSAMRR